MFLQSPKYNITVKIQYFGGQSQHDTVIIICHYCKFTTITVMQCAVFYFGVIIHLGCSPGLHSTEWYRCWTPLSHSWSMAVLLSTLWSEAALRSQTTLLYNHLTFLSFFLCAVFSRVWEWVAYWWTGLQNVKNDIHMVQLNWPMSPFCQLLFIVVVNLQMKSAPFHFYLCDPCRKQNCFYEPKTYKHILIRRRV